MRTAEEWAAHLRAVLLPTMSGDRVDRERAVSAVRRIQEEALEEAARVCGRIANERYGEYRERRDPRDDGRAMGAEECELGIRALAERAKGGDDDGNVDAAPSALLASYRQRVLEEAEVIVRKAADAELALAHTHEETGYPGLARSHFGRHAALRDVADNISERATGGDHEDR